MRDFVGTLAGLPGDDIALIRSGVADGIDTLEQATAWMAQTGKRDAYAAAAGSVPYLRMFGLVAGGYVLAKMAAAALSGLTAPGGDAPYLEAKLLTARSAETILPESALLWPIAIRN